jgi:hypothetical protein
MLKRDYAFATRVYEKRTAMHQAIYNGFFEMGQLLVQFGAGRSEFVHLEDQDNLDVMTLVQIGPKMNWQATPASRRLQHRWIQLLQQGATSAEAETWIGGSPPVSNSLIAVH